MIGKTGASGVFAWIVVFVMVAGAVSPSAAEPAATVITGFSSQGGNPTNKVSPADRMYLVKPGDKITFSVTAKGATAYEWQVNKQVQPQATGASFTWTAPNKKMIWEIHLTAAGSGEAHAEWVVSTLSIAEAPDYFDSFTDKRFKGRTETDPWARHLPEWRLLGSGMTEDMVDTTEGCLKPAAGVRKISLRGEIPRFNFGTARILLKQKYVPTDFRGVTIGFSLANRERQVRIGMGPSLDSHQYFRYLRGGQHTTGTGMTRVNYFLSAPIINSDPTCLVIEDGKWHEIKMIRNREDGYLALFYDDELMTECFGTPAENIDIKAELLNLILTHGAYGKLGIADGVEVYRDKYLLPARKAYLGTFPRSWIRQKPPKAWGVTEGLILKGRGLTLKRISDLVGNPALFEYDQATKTAISHTSLSLRGGAELIMDGETLLMDSKPGKELCFRVQNCATIKLNKSVIGTTGPAPYYWSFTSAVNREVYKDDPNCGLRTLPARYHHNSHVWFTARQTTFKNTGYFFFDAPAKLVLDDVKFLDLVAADRGHVYETSSRAKRYENPNVTGAKSLWFFNGMPLEGFTVRNIEIKGKAGPTETNILCFLTESETPIMDSVLENVKVKKGFSYEKFSWPGVLPPEIGGRAALVNCRFGKINVATDLVSAAVKYYLDVLVVDKNNNPVPGALVTVTNEQDDTNFYAHSLERYRKDERVKTVGYHFRQDPVRGTLRFDKWFLGKRTSGTRTGADGHTPLPSDAVNTVVVSDFVQDKDGKSEFTYRVTVQKGAMTKVVKGVNPSPAWYRSDPDKPTRTVTVILDGKAGAGAELKNNRPAGST